NAQTVFGRRGGRGIRAAPSPSARTLSAARRHPLDRTRASLFPCFATLAFSFCREVVSNKCLKINRPFEIGGDRADKVCFSVQVRCQIHRGRRGGAGERALRLFFRPDRTTAASSGSGRADGARERRARADGAER